jgi:F0F1-type ATP synthase membrane subunit b/b'
MEKAFMFLSFFLGFLSVGLGVGAIVFANILSKRTDVLIKTEDERAKSLIKELGEMTKETQKMIEEGNRRTQEMIREMDKRHQETMRYLQQSLDYLGSLIKADGQQTRELINKILEKMPG